MEARLPPAEVVPHPLTTHSVPAAYSSPALGRAIAPTLGLLKSASPGEELWYYQGLTVEEEEADVVVDVLWRVVVLVELDLPDGEGLLVGVLAVQLVAAHLHPQLGRSHTGDKVCQCITVI